MTDTSLESTPLTDRMLARLAAQEPRAEQLVAALVLGRDYGEIKAYGDDDTTPTAKRANDKKKKPPRRMLFKAGADRLTDALEARPAFTLCRVEAAHDQPVRYVKKIKDWSGPQSNRRFTLVDKKGEALGVYRYVVRCQLVRLDGVVLGEALAACSTLETKYIDRPRDVENTIVQMACKRAHSAAVLHVTGLSGHFDLSEEGVPDADGVIHSDPTDGITIAKALLFEVNGTVLGSMNRRSLKAARTWCDGKLAAKPTDPWLLRTSAMINLVSAHKRDAAAAAARAAQIASTAARPGDTSSSTEEVSDAR